MTFSARDEVMHLGASLQGEQYSVIVTLPYHMGRSKLFLVLALIMGYAPNII